MPDVEGSAGGTIDDSGQGTERAGGATDGSADKAGDETGETPFLEAFTAPREQVTT